MPNYQDILLYRIVNKQRCGLVKIKEYHSNTCYLLPASKLVQFSEIMQAFTEEDRYTICELANLQK